MRSSVLKNLISFKKAFPTLCFADAVHVTNGSCRLLGSTTRLAKASDVNLSLGDMSLDSASFCFWTCVLGSDRHNIAQTIHIGYELGTLRQCRSQKFQKCVRKLSEICQKTVSYIKLSEICQKCVRKVSKMCQIQNYVKNVSDQNQKCLRNVSKVKNVSEKHQF